MPEIAIERTVRAPIDRVFRAFTDFENSPQYFRGIRRVEFVTEGPIGVGTRFRETRVMFNREATEEMEIVAFEPPRRCELRCESCGVEWRSAFDFEPAPEGTRVRLHMRSRSLTLFARLFAPLGWLMTGTMKKMITADIDDAQALAEGQPAVQPNHG